jgi:hypothetical protein
MTPVVSSPTYKYGYYGKQIPINTEVEIIMSENVIKNPNYSLGDMENPMLIAKNDIFLKAILIKREQISSGGHGGTYQYTVLHDEKSITSTNDEPTFYFKLRDINRHVAHTRDFFVF